MYELRERESWREKERERGVGAGVLCGKSSSKATPFCYALYTLLSGYISYATGLWFIVLKNLLINYIR